MKRTPILLLSCALIAACTIASSQGQNSSPAETKTAVFAGGCFWCIQPAFDKANGVIKTVVGYCGGTEPNPTYELVSSEKTGYRESIQITYDPLRSHSISCSISTGGKSTRHRRMASSPTSGRVIVPRSFTTITKKKRLPKLQKKSSRAQENSRNRS